MLRLVTRRALCTSVAVPTTPPAITSRVQQIFEDHSATSSLADSDTKFKVSAACRLPSAPHLRYSIAVTVCVVCAAMVSLAPLLCRQTA